MIPYKINFNKYFKIFNIFSILLIIASIFLIILYYSYNKHPKFNLELVIILSFIGITGNFLPFYLISWAEQYIPSSTAG